MLNLGLAYATGRGVEQDSVEAVKWYAQAAERGYAKAQYNLALMYVGGHGVEQDDEEAASWFRRAAREGYAKG